MHGALAWLRILGAFVAGLILGISSIQVVGMVQPDPVGLLVPIVIYALIGGAVIILAPLTAGVALLMGWVAPWLLITLVVITAEFNPYVPFPAGVTVLYVLALGVAAYRASQHRRKLVSG